ncbi:hypothetical protein WCLP8_5360002 [uncultured Gammaproteobacteria bacterium]
MPEDDDPIRSQLRQATETLLETLDTFASSGRLDRVEQLANRIDELSSLRNFPAELRKAVDVSSKIMRNAYKQKITDLIDLAASMATGSDIEVKTAILNLINEILVKAQNVGTDAKFIDDVKCRVARHRPAQSLPDAPFENCSVFSAVEISRETFAPKTMPDQDWRTRRFNKPPLTVALLGKPYQTRNWTERGFVLTDFAQVPPLGAKLHAELRCDIAPDFLAKCWIRVTRCDPAHHLVAVEFENASPIGSLIEQITATALNI